MCNIVVINRGEIEITTPRQFQEHFGFAAPREPYYATVDVDSCLCQVDVEKALQDHNIPFKKDCGDFYVGQLDQVNETKYQKMKFTHVITLLEGTLIKDLNKLGKGYDAFLSERVKQSQVAILLLHKEQREDVQPPLQQAGVRSSLPLSKINRLIESIYVNEANLKHIAETKTINGTLYEELVRVLNEAAKLR